MPYLADFLFSNFLVFFNRWQELFNYFKEVSNWVRSAVWKLTQWDNRRAVPDPFQPQCIRWIKFSHGYNNFSWRATATVKRSLWFYLHFLEFTYNSPPCSPTTQRCSRSVRELETAGTDQVKNETRRAGVLGCWEVHSHWERVTSILGLSAIF